MPSRHRRRAAVLAATLLLATAGAALATVAPRLLSGERSATRTAFTADIPVGSGPRAVIAAAGSVWVANNGESTVTRITAGDSTTTGVITTPITVGLRPAGMVYDGSRVWVAVAGTSSAVAIDPSTNEVSATVALASAPSGITFDGTRVWTAGAAGKLTAIDAATASITAAYTKASGHDLGAIVYDTKLLWVTAPKDKVLYAIKPGDGSTNNMLSLTGTPREFGFDGTRAWLGVGQDAVMALSPAGWIPSLGPKTTVRGTPSGMALDLPGYAGTGGDALDPAMYLWVVNSTSNAVTKIATASREVVAVYPVGFSPSGAAFDGTYLWVTQGTTYGSVARIRVR